MSLAALALAVACATPSPLTLPDDPMRINQGLEVLFDPQRAFSLEDVASQRCNEFQPISGTPNFGNDRRGVWLRFRLPAGSTQETQRLLVRFGGLDRVCAHWPVREGTYRTQCAGSEDVHARGSHAELGYYFTLPADLDAGRPVLVYAHGDVWLKTPLEIGSADGFVRHEYIRQTGWGLYYGFLFAAVVLGITIYAGNRDQTYLFFSAHLAAITLALALWEGHLAAWDPRGWALTHIVPQIVALFFALGARFYQMFLQTQSAAPQLHHLLNVPLYAALGAVIVQPLFPTSGNALIGLIAMLWLALVLLTSVRRLAQGFRPAAASLLAMGALLAGVFLNALEVLDLAIVDAETANVVAYIGTLFSAAFLAGGLTWRVRQMAGAQELAEQNLAQAQQQLAQHRARFDDMTGLPTRTKFMDDLHARIDTLSPVRDRLALLVLGLDRFRAINHALGHATGDAVLAEIAERLRAVVAPGELLGRIGPDIFALAVQPSDDADRMLQNLHVRCAELRRRIGAPLATGRDASLTASVGVACYPEHGLTAAHLLRSSDAALYRAKDRGGGVLEVFEPELLSQAGRFLEMNTELHQAFERDEFELFYQPAVAIPGGRVLGLEALLRWRRPNGEYLSPDEFLPVIDAGELMEPISRWVYRTACNDIATWRRGGLADAYVAVNVPASQFLSTERLVHSLECALDDAGLPGEAIMVEITEETLLDDLSAARSTLEQLRARRVRVAVDDFGVGYSSLTYLRNLPLSALKIDRSFLHGVPDDQEAVSVVNAIITLGRELHLGLIAEGVETEAQHGFLASRGVPSAQGFHYCRPMPPRQLKRWLAQRVPGAQLQ